LVLRLPLLLPHQEKFFLDPARDVCCYSSTQVGKTFVCACWLVAQAWTRPNCLVSWFAPVEKQLRQGFETCKSIAHAAGIIQGSPRESEGSRELAITNGAVIEFHSWHNPEHLAGPTIHAFVADEAGLLTKQAHSTISTRRSRTLGPGRYIGNPGILGGQFKRLCAAGEKEDRVRTRISTHSWSWEDLYEAYLFTGEEEQAAEYKEFIESEKEVLPEMEFRRMYGGEWIAGESTVFTNVDECTYGPPSRSVLDLPPWNVSSVDVTLDLLRTDPFPQDLPQDLLPRYGRFIIGVDVGQTNDYFSATVVDDAPAPNSEHPTQLFRAVHLMRFRGVPSPQQEEHCVALERLFPKAVFIVENNGPGIQLIPRLQMRGLRVVAFTTSSQSKNDIVTGLAAGLQTGEFTMAEMPPLPDELKAFQYSQSDQMLGVYKYGAPEDEHDDTTISTAIAYWGARKRSGIYAGVH